MLSHGVGADAKHVNAQARVCAYQVRLYFFPGSEALPQIIKEMVSRDCPTPKLFWSNPY